MGHCLQSNYYNGRGPGIFYHWESLGTRLENCLALFPGPAQLFVTCSTEKAFARRESLGTRLENCQCYLSRAHQVVCNEQVRTVFNFTMGCYGPLTVWMIMSCCTTNYQLFNLIWLLSVEDLPYLCKIVAVCHCQMPTVDVLIKRTPCLDGKISLEPLI